MSKVKVAVVQLPHINFNVHDNIERAVAAIQQAAESGAQLVLLPEFCTTGYLLTDDLWEFAEVVPEGPTLTRFQQVACASRIAIAGTVLEATAEGHFYNTFFFVEPDQEDDNNNNNNNNNNNSSTCRLYTCRKSEPAHLEGNLVQGGDGSDPPPVFETRQFGTIAVSMCYDTMLLSHQHRLLQGLSSSSSPSPPTKKKTPFDLLLCPHAAFTPHACILFPKARVVEFNRLLEQTPHRLAKLYGVPVLMANKIGPMDGNGDDDNDNNGNSSFPWPWSWLLPNPGHTFPGFSSICAGDGMWLQAAQNDPVDGGPMVEVLTASVYLGEDNRSLEKVHADLTAATNRVTVKRYIVTLPLFFAWVWTHVMEPMGTWSYQRSAHRRMAAARRAVDRGSQPSTQGPPPPAMDLSSWVLLSTILAVLVGGTAYALQTIRISHPTTKG